MIPKIFDGSIDAIDADLLILPYVKKEKPITGAMGFIDWHLAGRLSELVISNFVKGNLYEKTLVVDHSSKLLTGQFFLIGLGENKQTESASHVSKISESIVKVVCDSQSKNFGLLIDNLLDNNPDGDHIMTILEMLKEELDANHVIVHNLFLIFSDPAHIKTIGRLLRDVVKKNLPIIHLVLYDQRDY